MPKKLLILISLFLFISLSKEVSAQSETQLVLYPPSVKKQPGDIFATEIRISGNEQILGTDLDIKYDPTVLEAQKISPGDFFTEPQILTNQIDKENGLIKYSIFSYPLHRGSGTIIVITFKALKETSLPAEISFAPTTTVSTIGERKITFKTASSLVEIVKKSALPTLKQSFTPTEIISPAPFLTPTPTPAPQKPRQFSFLLGLTKILGTILLLGGVLILVFTLTIL